VQFYNLGCILIIACTIYLVRRWWLRRTSEDYFNFDNPIYRKKMQQNGSDVTRLPRLPRNSSKVELMESQEYGNASETRRSSDESESPTNSDEHVYRPVNIDAFLFLVRKIDRFIYLHIISNAYTVVHTKIHKYIQNKQCAGGCEMTRRLVFCRADTLNDDG